MLPSHAVSTATRYWAAHFGESGEHLISEPFRLVTHRGELEGYHGVFALFREGSVVVSLPPERADPLRALLSLPPLVDSPERLIDALAPVATRIVGPAWIGYATEVPLPMPPARALSADDQEALACLREGCTPIDWDHGGSSLDQPCSGVFVDGRLAALAGYEIWGGTIAHIAVVSHPDLRGRGYGRGAVAHLAARALTTGLLPQYRTLDANIPSVRVAETLGFHRFATSVAVRLPV